MAAPMMDHPSIRSSEPSDPAPRGRTFNGCRPSGRCAVCRLLTEHPEKEEAILRSLIATEDGLLEALERLAALFYDAATPAA